MPRYKVLNGLDYGSTRREPGDIADDIPGASVPWLLEDGHIERIEDDPPKPRAPKAQKVEEEK